MITVGNAVLVTIDNDDFRIRNLTTGKVATISVSKFIGHYFKYESEISPKFISAVIEEGNTSDFDVICTEAAARKIGQIIEFNRVDSWSSVSGATTSLLAPFLYFYINNLTKTKNIAPGIPKIPIRIDV